MKKLPLIIMIIASFAYGQVWYPAILSENNNTYFYDPNSIRRSGDVVTYWEMVDYAKPLIVGTLAIASTRSKVAQNCQNRSFIVTDLIDYDGPRGAGNIVNIELARTSTWRDVPPGSVGEGLIQKVCN